MDTATTSIMTTAALPQVPALDLSNEHCGGATERCCLCSPGCSGPGHEWDLAAAMELLLPAILCALGKATPTSQTSMLHASQRVTCAASPAAHSSVAAPLCSA